MSRRDASVSARYGRTWTATMLAGAPETTAGAADQCLPCATAAHGDEVYGDFGTLGQDPLGGAIQTATATSAQPSPAEESQLVAINCRPDANQRAFLFALLVQNVESWAIPEEETGKPKLYAAYLSGYEGWPFNGLTSLQISEISRYCAK